MSVQGKILCIGFTPAVQRTLNFSSVELGEVNRASSVTLSPAGKGVNVARVLKTLGSEPLLAGFLGGDSGLMVAGVIQTWGIDTAWVETEAPTRNCHTLVEDGGRRVTELVEEMICPAPAEWGRMDKLLNDALPASAWLAISGKPPQGADPDCYAKIIDQANRHDVRCVIDSQGDVLSRALIHKPYLVKLNAEELGVTCGTDARDVEAGIAAIRKLGALNVMVTQGAKAVWLADDEGIVSFVPPTIKPVNPIGSGDSVTAGVLSRLAAGGSLREAAIFGVACGTANALTAEPALLDPAVADEFFELLLGS